MTGITGVAVLPPNASRPWTSSAGRPMDLQSDFRDLLASFNASGVEYLVVGGRAHDTACATAIPASTSSTPSTVCPATFSSAAAIWPPCSSVAVSKA